VTSGLATWRTCAFRFGTSTFALDVAECTFQSQSTSPFTLLHLPLRGCRLLVPEGSACSKAESGGEVHDLQLQHRLPSWQLSFTELRYDLAAGAPIASSFTRFLLRT